LVDCNSTANGVLNQGIRAALVTLEETTESLFTAYNINDSSYDNKYAMLNDQDLVQACKFHILLIFSFFYN